jgi:predicted acetyltransferase
VVDGEVRYSKSVISRINLGQAIGTRNLSLFPEEVVKMIVELRQVTIDEKEILRNLLEKYSYEFSQWDKRDVNKLGLYDYQYLDYYWTENKRWAYFIIVDGKLAGFVMVNDLPEVGDRETDFQISEFFVMHKYRRLGVGRQAFFKVLDMHKGKWQLKRHPANVASVYFWDNVINEYTNGEFELVKAYPGTEYDDGTLADVFFFKS